MRVTRQAEGVSAEVSDADSFAALVAPYWTDMARFAQRLVGIESAEDVLQEALASAWRSRHRLDRSVGNPRAWLLAIVANEARDQRALHRRTRRMFVEGAGRDEPDQHPTPVLAMDMTDALHRLTDRQRTAVALHYYLGLNMTECGEVLGCAPGTVKSTLSDARARLRVLLGEDYR